SAAGAAWLGCRRTALSTYGIVGRRLQCVLNVVYCGPLREVETGRLTTPDRPCGTHGHHRHDGGSGRVDSGHQRLAGTVYLFTGCARIFGSADFRGVLLWRIFETPECERRTMGYGGWLRTRNLPNAGGYARSSGHRRTAERLPAGLVPL